MMDDKDGLFLEALYKRSTNYYEKVIISISIILLIFTLVGCERNERNNELITEIGNSIKFTEKEISKAIESVKNNFNFPASTLTKIWYDEEKSDSLIISYLEHGRGSVNGAKDENVIVLLTNFDVDDSGDNPVLNPGSTYENYQWILIRDNNTSKWKIDDAGY